MYEEAFHFGDIRQKKILVTGGAGFIGANIVEYLLKHGAAKVRVLDNLATGNYSNLTEFESNPAFEFMEGDIRNAAICESACEDMDIVSHQAAMGSVPRSINDPVTTNDVNVGGFVNMITAAKNAGVQRFVYASSSSVYGDHPGLPKVEDQIGQPLSPYAVSKRADELYAKVFFDVYNFPVTGLRYFNVFGPKQDPSGAYAAVIPLFVEGILNEKEIFIDGDGEQTRDFTFVENAVQANIRAMTLENDAAFGKIYNVAVGENYSINHLFNTINKVLDTDKKAIHREPRAGDVRNSLADISRTQKDLQYQPRIKFEHGLKQTVAYFKQHFTA